MTKWADVYVTWFLLHVSCFASQVTGAVQHDFFHKSSAVYFAQAYGVHMMHATCTVFAVAHPCMQE